MILPTPPDSNPYYYVILGAGRQGTAAAYDLAVFGHARKIVLADVNYELAIAAAERVNTLSGKELARGVKLDVANADALREILQPAHVALSAVPYKFNLLITQVAIETATHLVDMGGNTAIVRQQFELDAAATSAGVSVVPDCGMGPGLINTMAAYAIELLDDTSTVKIYDAGLPQSPTPPWNYALTFHINGLTNEMDGQAVFLRDGKITLVDTLTEPEMIDFPPFGILEADVTSGGTSLAPWTFQGRVDTYENKVLRYPGHYEWLRAFKQLGLFREDAVLVDGQPVIPRKVYHALLEPQITSERIQDVCIIRVVATGIKANKPVEVTIDLVDYYDPSTGFTGMERLTGWHSSIMMIFQAVQRIRPGVTPVEIAVPAGEFMQALAQRGIPNQVRFADMENNPSDS